MLSVTSVSVGIEPESLHSATEIGNYPPETSGRYWWRYRKFSHFAPERPADILLTCGRSGVSFSRRDRAQRRDRLAGQTGFEPETAELLPLKLRRNSE